MFREPLSLAALAITCFLFLDCSKLRPSADSSTQASTANTQSTTSVSTGLPNNSSKRYRGVLGKDEMEMILTRKEHKITGKIRFIGGGQSGPGGWDVLKGTIDDNGEIVLNESDDADSGPFSVWKGRFVKPNRCAGTVTSLSGDGRPENFAVTEVGGLETAADRQADLQAQVFREASKQESDWLLPRYKKCGNYYFMAMAAPGRPPGWLAQIAHQPNAYVQGDYIPPRDLSETDKLNGVDPQPFEWQGKTHLIFGPYRVLPLSGVAWGGNQWKDSYEMSYGLNKQKGKWVIVPDAGTSNPVPFDCSNIPESMR